LEKDTLYERTFSSLAIAPFSTVVMINLTVHVCGLPSILHITVQYDGGALCVLIIGVSPLYHLLCFNDTTDDDECALGSAHCEELGPAWQCENTQGSFRCVKKVCTGFGEELNETSGYCERKGTTKECGPGFRKRQTRVLGPNVAIVSEDCEGTVLKLTS
jgi:hypothetical protein